MKRIVVVGSLNMDLVLKVDRLPKTGETLAGDNISYFIGGKGCNQAVAAVRLENNVNIIGAIGEDAFGDKIINHLNSEGICSETIKKDNKSFTGIATIFKTPEDNSIVVIKGANELCDIKLVNENAEVIRNSDVLLTQFEIPMETVKEALKIAKSNNVKTIVNPAPAKYIDKDLLKYIDYITPNEIEFELICGKVFENIEQLELEIIKWQNNNNTTLIVTRGKDGVSFVENNKVITIESMEVQCIDTTGAGDTFNGALAHCIANNYNLKKAVNFSSKAATLSVTKLGAQTGMPKLDEVNKYL